jgi:tRNA pseudouridine55 synthase
LQLLPPQMLVAAYPSVTLDADNAGRFLSGLRRLGTPGQWGPDAALVQVFGPVGGSVEGSVDGAVAGQNFLGSAHITADELIPQRLLNPIEIRQIAAATERARGLKTILSDQAPATTRATALH